MRKKPTGTANNVTTSQNIVPVYTVNKKPVDAAAGHFMMENQPKKFELSINNVKIEITDNIKGIDLTTTGINITFK